MVDLFITLLYITALLAVLVSLIFPCSLRVSVRLRGSILGHELIPLLSITDVNRDGIVQLAEF